MKYQSTIVYTFLLSLIFCFSGFSQTIIPGGSFGGSQLSVPHGIEIHNGVIYVVDKGSRDVEMFDLQTKQSLGNFGGGDFMGDPFGIAIAGNIIYVCDFAGPPGIAKFDLNTKTYLGHFTNGALSNPQDIAIAGGKIFVCDNNNDYILKFDQFTETYEGNFGNAQLSQALHLTIYDGIIYVTENLEVEMFDLGSPHTSLGNFSTAVTNNRGIDIGSAYIFLGKTAGLFEARDLQTKESLGTFGDPEIIGAQGVRFYNYSIFIADESSGDVEMFMLQGIPTLSQWGLMCLGLLLLIFGTVGAFKLGGIAASKKAF